MSSRTPPWSLVWNDLWSLISFVRISSFAYYPRSKQVDKIPFFMSLCSSRGGHRGEKKEERDRVENTTRKAISTAATKNVYANQIPYLEMETVESNQKKVVFVEWASMYREVLIV